MSKTMEPNRSTERISLSVIVVAYGNSDMVRKCLRSLLECRHEVGELTVWVVDNNSPDGTVQVVREEFPEVRLLCSQTNDGFSVANNKVLNEFRDDYCLLLNPDTEMRPGVIRHLLLEMEGMSDVGLMGCRLITANGTFDHAAKRRIPTPFTAFSYLLNRNGNSAYLAPEVGEFMLADVEAINGAFMLARRSAVHDVGGLDERYWMYAEDLDWCVRMRKSGWRVMYDGRVTCVHLKGGVSGRARSPKLNWHFHRSMHLFYMDHAATGVKPVDVVVVGAIYARGAIRVVIDQTKRSGNHLRRTVRACKERIWGRVDG